MHKVKQNMSVQEHRDELEVEQDVETEVQPEIEIEANSVVLNSDEVRGAASEVSDSASISDFRAPRSNINHGHGPDKHDVRSSFGVRDEFVEDVFSEYGIAPNDHAAMWLMSYKKQEFINNDTKVFKDTHDADSSRWGDIESTRSSAPIAPETQQELKR